METSNKTLDAIKSEGLAISQRELVNVFGPKASGDLSAAEVQKLYQDMPGFLARNQERDEIFGTHEGLIGRSGKKDQDHRRLLDRQKQQGKEDGGIDIAFLQMLQDGTLGSYIGDQVFGGMSDDEIAAVVTEIELETGKPFEEYAKEVLGDDMPKRKDDESEADYHRRLLKDHITPKMIDPKTGKIRPEYADDPTAKIIKRNDDYKQTVEAAKAYDEEMKSALDAGDKAKIEVVKQQTGATAQEGYGTSKTMSGALENESLVEVSESMQDEHREGDSQSSLSLGESTSFLNGLGISAKPISASFEVAAAGEAVQDVSPTEAGNSDIKLPTGTDLPKPV